MNNNNSLDYRSDGKNFINRNLGLPVSEHAKNIKWPAPYQIISKNKRETIPVAFRIDEVAYASLDSLANRFGISVSSLANEIINAYLVDNQSQIPDKLEDHVVDLSLERLKNKLLKMTDSQIHELAKDGYYAGEPMPYDLDDGILVSHSNELFLIKEGDEEKAILETATEDFHSFCGPITKGDKMISVPVSKWDIVFIIISSYYRKTKQFYFNKRTTLRHSRIVHLINNNAGKNLIAALIDEMKSTRHALPTISSNNDNNNKRNAITSDCDPYTAE